MVRVDFGLVLGRGGELAQFLGVEANDQISCRLIQYPMMEKTHPRDPMASIFEMCAQPSAN
jgi:hypothetical protein